MTVAAKRILPSGTVTFLFTDIEGSTELVRSLGDAYPPVLDQHRDVLRSVWARHEGAEVNAEGDGFLVAFDSADRALAAAVDGQAALADTPWRTTLPVLVRMGLHRGFARPHGDDYAALAVHQAARIVGAAHGGQVLLSSEVRAAVDEPPAGVELEALGTFRIRDFPRPETLYQARSRSLPVGHWVPRARPADGHNLLPPTTVVRGRDADLEQLASLVAPGRLVTLVGPGGIGKTRVAVEYGLRVADSWPDGVWFIDLARTTAADHLHEAVAEAIGARAVPGQETRLDVLDHLSGQQLLLLLDNCEHLTPAPAEFAQEVLQACPDVGVLATSRVRLGLRAEHVHRLPPLDTVGDDAAAVQLFLERSGATGEHDPESVRELCASLDGLPLAIEIAGSQAATLGLDLVMQRLEHSSGIIRSHDPTVPPRHRTLAAVLDASFELLDPSTRRLLGQMAVVPAGFDFDDACGAWGDQGQYDLFDRIQTLVEHSLLIRDTSSGATRFRLPATVRSHALDSLDRDARTRAAQAMGRVLRDRLGPEHSNSWEWVSAVGVEVDNLRSIIGLVAGADDELGQTLAWAIGYHHDCVNAFATGVHDLRAHLELLRAPTPTRIALLCLLADMLLRRDRVQEAAEELQQARRLRAETPEPEWDDACVARTTVELAIKGGDVAAGLAAGREALARAVSDRGRSRLLSVLGVAHATVGDLGAALDAFEEELGIEVDAGMHTNLGTTLGNIAETLRLMGDRPGSALHQLRAMEHARSHGDMVQLAFSMLVAADLCSSSERHGEAVALHAAATSLLDDAGFVMYEPDRRTYEAVLDAARRATTPSSVEAARHEGQALGVEGAAERAAAVLRSYAAAPARSAAPLGDDDAGVSMLHEQR